MEFTETDVTSLTTKLDEMDLTEAERAALMAVFVAAADMDEVSGFAYDLNPNDLSFKSFHIGVQPPRGLGGPQLQFKGFVATNMIVAPDM